MRNAQSAVSPPAPRRWIRVWELPAVVVKPRSAGRGPLREFALGIEALERFVRREPLRRVHECVFGVLALESEPVDPRL